MVTVTNITAVNTNLAQSGAISDADSAPPAEHIARKAGEAEQALLRLSQKALSPELPDEPAQKAAEVIDKFLEQFLPPNTRLRINQDKDAGLFVYQAVDRVTGEVVSQFPPETVLRQLAMFRSTEGIVFDDRA